VPEPGWVRGVGVATTSTPPEIHLMVMVDCGRAGYSSATVAAAVPGASAAAVAPVRSAVPAAPAVPEETRNLPAAMAIPVATAALAGPAEPAAMAATVVRAAREVC
ncbi:hypothetical protein OSI33_08630, partial [Mycobacterium ulcerans]